MTIFKNELFLRVTCDEHFTKKWTFMPIEDILSSPKSPRVLVWRDVIFCWRKQTEWCHSFL